MSYCGGINVQLLVGYVSLMNYMEWIPQPCLCMLVGFNEGFTAAVSQWLTEMQPSQLQGVALLLGLKLHPE